MTPKVVVAGLGPAGPDLLTVGTREAIARIPRRFLRTRRHPAAEAVSEAESFDELYERAESFEDVYHGIADALVAAAGEHGEVLYLVPGSPGVAERSVELLLADGRVPVEVLPAVSFTDLVWARVGTGARLVDAYRFAEEAAGERGPFVVYHCHSRALLSEVKLAVDDGPDVLVLQRLGLPDEAVFEVPWADVDRAFEPDHLTSVYVPALSSPVAGELVRFHELVRTLRERCPWDREQTHRSLTRHLLEETYEVLEAIEGDDPDHLCEELGDLLFQVFFHAVLGAEAGQFDLADVARGIHDKLVRRHPHVFGSVEAGTAGEVMKNWEQIKQEEKGRSSLMDGIPGDLPSLLHAHKVQRKAASVGFDWPAAEPVYEKVVEELEEVRADPSDDEVGDLLFAVVNLARHLGVDPEAALRGATAKFRDRFRAMEALAAERGVPLSDDLWDEVKRFGMQSPRHDA
ncbi:MAG TPA: nucleoside triphosphate pyrophosphohydrolase [Acidimicrobiales bacterium]|nr:nucleoside triphosphate pyrophosphohydrolase [Acidimicrobiales bacterium]